MKRIIWYLLISASLVLSTPTDEFLQIIGENEDIKINDQPMSTAMYIVPSGMPGHITSRREDLSDIINENNKLFQKFKQLIEKGAKKSLTFNIYDDNMREATVTLFRLMQEFDVAKLDKFNDWLIQHINLDMLQYVQRLLVLYTKKHNHICQCPPFQQNPKYFTNAETIVKANRLKSINGLIQPDEAKINQYFRNDNLVSINTNYSGWNLMENGFQENLNYFREDVGLNSYYYGVNLLHPYWMSNDELDKINPRHAEYYFYSHQQLLARYKLEMEHLRNYTHNKVMDKVKHSGYDPYLRYENGLSFPIRYDYSIKYSESLYLSIISAHMAMTECIKRGFIVMNNGTKINLTEENHTNLIVKLFRANFDNVTIAKIVRSLYGANGYPYDVYNPAPSVLHHPQTTLREPIYWDMVERDLMYILDYRAYLDPFDLSEYELSEYNIMHSNLPNITTYFDYYQYNINEGLDYAYTEERYEQQPIIYAARQRRLKHREFTFNFTVNSKIAKDIVIRLFIGPQCDKQECFVAFTKFFELDNQHMKLREGKNLIVWSPSKSSRFSNDDEYNLEIKNKSNINYRKKQKYSIFKFPERLVIPKGTEEGIKFKLFVIITDAVPEQIQNNKEHSVEYNNKINQYETDSKPLGFPFHRISKNYNEEANNYKLYDIYIYHEKRDVDESGYFSPHLY